jgi:molybdopterin/thiamine biosynthesis adenylyltransferase
MNDFAPDRHARHRMIGWFDQDRLAQARVLVIGAGAIGNEVCKNLALLGVGHVTVWDRDRVELHNLTRSVLFRESDVGRAKAEVVAERAGELDPGVRFSPVEADVIAAMRPSHIDGHEVVFGCLDNFEARLRINELCLIAGVDLVDGAIDARHASIEHFPFSAGRTQGCYECGLPESAYQRVAQRYSCGGMRRAGLAERKVPTTIVTSSLAGALMVSWGLRMGGPSGDAPRPRRVLVDAIGARSQPSAIARNPACPACSGLTHDRIERLVWRANDPMRFGLAAQDLRIRLPEPVVLGARCTACGADASLALRPGSRLRSHTTDAICCLSCGADAVSVDARDQVFLAELLTATGGRPPELPYLWVDDPRVPLCVEIDHD